MARQPVPPLKKPATYADIEALPEHQVGERVRHAWLITPESRLLEVLRLDGDFWSLIAAHRDDELVRAEPFDAIELDLLPLWGETRKQAEQSAP